MCIGDRVPLGGSVALYARGIALGASAALAVQQIRFLRVWFAVTAASEVKPPHTHERRRGCDPSTHKLTIVCTADLVSGTSSKYCALLIAVNYDQDRIVRSSELLVGQPQLISTESLFGSQVSVHIYNLSSSRSESARFQGLPIYNSSLAAPGAPLLLNSGGRWRGRFTSSVVTSKVAVVRKYCYGRCDMFAMPHLQACLPACPSGEYIG